MSPRLSAVRIGVRRGVTELRQMLTSPGELAFDIVFAAVILIVLYFVRNKSIAGTDLPLGAVMLPGVVGMLVTFSATTLASFTVAFEREDGTLLRAKAAPFGLVSYVTGHAVRTPLYTVLYLLLVLVPGLLIVDGLSAGLRSWAMLAGYVVLGLLAGVPIGMALGSAASNPRAVAGNLFLVSGVLIAISGIFYPITSLPGWLHPIAQVFPFYWLGLGMRSALLPEAAVALELTESWRHLQTVAVLGAWAVAGFLLAPPLLRRMARRVSGASVEAGRHKAAQRVG